MLQPIPTLTKTWFTIGPVVALATLNTVVQVNRCPGDCQAPNWTGIRDGVLIEIRLDHQSLIEMEATHPPTTLTKPGWAVY